MQPPQKLDTNSQKLDIDMLIKFTTTWYANRDPNENIDVIDHILLYIMHHFILYNAAQIIIELQIIELPVIKDSRPMICFVHKTPNNWHVIASVDHYFPPQTNTGVPYDSSSILNTAAANATIKIYAALHRIADVVRNGAMIMITKK
jgi:hypothetical protein